jgi:hypothetical protein
MFCCEMRQERKRDGYCIFVDFHATSTLSTRLCLDALSLIDPRVSNPRCCTEYQHLGHRSCLWLARHSLSTQYYTCSTCRDIYLILNACTLRRVCWSTHAATSRETTTTMVIIPVIASRVSRLYSACTGRASTGEYSGSERSLSESSGGTPSNSASSVF